MPETKRHLELRTALYQILKLAWSDRACIGSEQFVYWNAADPRRCLSPDVFVRTGQPDALFGSWKTWERGAPELAVEIVSDSDASEPSLEEKLERYRELGVLELVRFDADAAPGGQLRAWDRIDGDLVERKVVDDKTPCVTLELFWVVRPAGEHPAAIRLARDPSGDALLPTPDEAREAAERRVAELEAELARR